MTSDLLLKVFHIDTNKDDIKKRLKWDWISEIKCAGTVCAKGIVGVVVVVVAVVSVVPLCKVRESSVVIEDAVSKFVTSGVNRSRLGLSSKLCVGL